MTDKKTEALKLALEALEGAEALLVSMGLTHLIVYGDAEKAITALREALVEQPELEEGCQCPACKVTPHASDCAVHNEPAYPKDSCDCGAQQQEPVAAQGPRGLIDIGRIFRGEDK